MKYVIVSETALQGERSIMTIEEFEDRDEITNYSSGWWCENLLELYTGTNDFGGDAVKIEEPLHEYMNEDDIKMFDALPNEFTIYRGCTSRELDGFYEADDIDDFLDSNGGYLGQSWTISLETAKWFAFRFGGTRKLRDEEGEFEVTNDVFQAKIKKRDIFAYEGREFEVIIDTSKLYDVEQVTSFDRDECIRNIGTFPRCGMMGTIDTKTNKLFGIANEKALKKWKEIKELQRAA